jgi:sugar lactone lactonase YvrE
MIAILFTLFGCNPDCDESGTACVVAGMGYGGLGADGGVARETPLYWPADVTLSPAGVPYVVDWNNHRVVRFQGEPDDLVLDVVSGGGMVGDGPLDGNVSTALWNHPTNLVFRDEDYVVMAAWHNSRVIAFDLANDQVEHLAGNGQRAFGGDGGPALDAVFDLPSAVLYGPDGQLYVTDQANQRIRCIDDDAIVTTVVGNGERGGDGDGGPALEASLRMEVSQNADPGGRLATDGEAIYIADTLNNRVRRIDFATWTIDTVVGNGGIQDRGTGVDEVGLYNPRDVAIAPDGTMYIADSGNHCVRRVQDGVVDTALGTCGQAGYGRDGAAAEFALDRPLGLDVGADGALWVTDTWNHRIVRVAP